VYLISQLILQNSLLAVLITVALLALFIFFWIIFPRSERLKDAVDGEI
jgi:hypothetical protein